MTCQPHPSYLSASVLAAVFTKPSPNLLFWDEGAGRDGDGGVVGVAHMAFNSSCTAEGLQRNSSPDPVVSLIPC